MTNQVEKLSKEDNTMNILNQQLTSYMSDNQYVSFNLDEEEYGIEVLLVQEIIRYHKPTKVPNGNKVVSGVINFRGKVIPLIDMRAKFGLATREYDTFTVIIVLEIKGKTVGLIVDRVYDIVSLTEQDIQFVDEDFIADVKAEYLRGMGKVGERLILLLDPERVLSFEELHRVTQITKVPPTDNSVADN